MRDKIGPSATSKDAPSGDAVYRGYIAVFKVIKDLIIEERKDFPTVSTVSAKLSEARSEGAEVASKHIAAYLDNGGKADYALDCIVDRAREELSPLGREYDAEREYIDAVLEGTDGRRRPECANDLDFALVRARLGLPADTLGVVPEDEEDSRDPESDDEE